MEKLLTLFPTLIPYFTIVPIGNSNTDLACFTGQITLHGLTFSFIYIISPILFTKTTSIGKNNFPTNYDKTKSEITKTIQMNEGDPANFTISTNSGYTMLEVAGSQKATFYFAKALGFQEPVVQVKARVDLYPLSVGSGAVPLTVQSSVNSRIRMNFVNTFRGKCR